MPKPAVARRMRQTINQFACLEVEVPDPSCAIVSGRVNQVKSEVVQDMFNNISIRTVAEVEIVEQSPAFYPWFMGNVNVTLTQNTPMASTTWPTITGGIMMTPPAASQPIPYYCPRCDTERPEQEHVEQCYSDGTVAWDGCCYCWDKLLDLIPRKYDAMHENAHLRDLLRSCEAYLSLLPAARGLAARIQTAITLPVTIPRTFKRYRPKT